MKRKFAIAVLIAFCFCLASCTKAVSYPGQVKSKYWISDNGQMYFYFPAEAGAGKAEGRILEEDAICHDVLLEWTGKDGFVEVKEAGGKLIFTADTATDNEKLTCTFHIKENPLSWNLPDTISFHWSKEPPEDLSSGVFKPQQTSLDLWILQNVYEKNWSDYTEVPDWMGAREFYGKGYTPEISDDGIFTDPEYCVKYLVTAWPDYADGGQYITQIVITDPKVTFWGLTVESTVEQFDSVLTPKGFLYVTEKDLDEGTEYKAAWVGRSYSVTLKKQNGKCVVNISAPISNRDNIVF